LKDADERDFCGTLRQRGTSWLLILWTEKVYWTRSQETYPFWWEEVWNSIRELTGDLSADLVYRR